MFCNLNVPAQILEIVILLRAARNKLLVEIIPDPLLKWQQTAFPLAFPSGIIVGAAVVKTTGSFPLSLESQITTHLFPGDSMPSGRYNYIVTARFMGVQCKHQQFPYSLSITMSNQHLLYFIMTYWSRTLVYYKFKLYLLAHEKSNSNLWCLKILENVYWTPWFWWIFSSV